MPPVIPWCRASDQGLPKSNHGQEVQISHADRGARASFDRRTIPGAAVEEFWTAADGHRIRNITWPQPEGAPRGSILFMPGRGDAYEKYIETFEHWRRQGWQVTGCDWRGQAASGRLGADELTGHIEDFGVWTADLAAFWEHWMANVPAPHVLAGHSMGGHLVLRAAADGLVRPDALILSAPMLDTHPTWVPLAVRQRFANWMASRGDPRRPAWKWSEKPGEFPAGRIKLLTHDEERYADEGYWREQRPEVVMGPGSWGWVARSLDSTAAIDAPGALEQIDIPVFLMGTRADKLVSFDAIARSGRRLPNVETLYFGSEARHEILREADPVRDRALAAIDGFLDRHFAT